MRTLDDPITQMMLKSIEDEIKCTEGITKINFMELKGKLLWACTMAEQALKEKNANNN